MNKVLIKDMPKHIQALIKAYQHIPKFYGVKAKSVASSFQWKKTPEGYEFWNNINKGNFEVFDVYYKK